MSLKPRKFTHLAKTELILRYKQYHARSTRPPEIQFRKRGVYLFISMKRSRPVAMVITGLTK